MAMMISTSKNKAENTMKIYLHGCINRESGEIFFAAYKFKMDDDGFYFFIKELEVDIPQSLLDEQAKFKNRGIDEMISDLEARLKALRAKK
jgi:hypothetical protein